MRKIRPQKNRFAFRAACKALVIFCLFSVQVQADSLQQKIQSLLKLNGRVQAGILIRDLDTGSVVFSLNADVPMIPASNMKVLTLATAVEQMGTQQPRFSFQTRLYKAGNCLVIIGDGDPAFGYEQYDRANPRSASSVLDRWAQAAAGAMGSGQAGGIIVDSSVFDRIVQHPDWEASDLKKSYGAPVGGINLNANCVEITAWPADDGQSVLWSGYPENGIVQMENRSMPASKGIPTIDRRENTFRYILFGPCSEKADLVPVSIPDPEQFFADAFSTALKRNDSEFDAEVRFERCRRVDGTPDPELLKKYCPDSSTPELLVSEETQLQDVMIPAGKDSHNLYAEALFKRSGYAWCARQGDPRPVGNWSTGRVAMLEMLDKAKSRVPGIVIRDGSGLSRKNRISASSLVGVLKYMDSHPQGDLFKESLAVAGQDGTLRKRLKELPAGAVRGKTGYIRGVRTFTGYVQSEGGHQYAVSILFNNIRGSTSAYTKMQDGICRLIYSEAR